MTYSRADTLVPIWLTCVERGGANLNESRGTDRGLSSMQMRNLIEGVEAWIA